MLYTCLGVCCWFSLWACLHGVPRRFGARDTRTIRWLQWRDFSTQHWHCSRTRYRWASRIKVVVFTEFVLSSCHVPCISHLVLTMLDIRTCAGTIRCMHHGSTDSGQCWKDCTWGESRKFRISIEDMTKSCRTFLDLNCNPQIHPSRTSALALMDLVRPSTGGTELSPSIPLQMMPESIKLIHFDVELPDMSGAHRWAAVTLLELIGSLLIAITAWDLGKWCLHCRLAFLYIISRIMSWTMSDLCEIHDFDMIYLWYPLIHYDLYSWQSDISGMTHRRWWTWGKSWEWSAPLGPPWSRAPTTWRHSLPSSSHAIWPHFLVPRYILPGIVYVQARWSFRLHWLHDSSIFIIFSYARLVPQTFRNFHGKRILAFGQLILGLCCILFDIWKDVKRCEDTWPKHGLVSGCIIMPVCLVLLFL